MKVKYLSPVSYLETTLLRRTPHHIIQETMDVYLKTFTDVDDLCECEIPLSYLIFVDEGMRSIQEFS
jgi:hypothetical protein